MSHTRDQLAALDRMREEGRISPEEYEDLREGIVRPDGASGEEGQPETAGVRLPTLRSDRSISFVAAIVFASVVVILIAYLGVLPWLAAVLGVIALAATLFEKGIWVSAAAGVGLGVFLITSLTGGTANPDSNVAPVVDTAPAAREPVAGSLGMYVEDLPELWNTVSDPPEIRGAFTRYTESGEYDSFLYRFGEWGRFAGAYDRENDAVYALAASGQFQNSAAADLYLHVCYIVEPFSQECIEAYFAQGLEGGVLDDYIDGSRDASWQLGENTWSVEIEGNVLTLRVLSPEVS
jgi:hypothetical protein